MSLNLIDILIVAFYFAIILIIGIRFTRKDNSENKESYILAGRRVTLPFFVASLVATWYGNIMGMGEFVYNYGIVAFFCFAFPYYIAALFFAIFVAKRIRASSAATIPEQIKITYGNKASAISSAIILVITIPAAYILILGKLIELFTGWSLELSLIIGTIISLIIIYHGGLKADIIANTAQFIFMYIGFGGLLFFCLTELGSFKEMLSRLPATHLTATGTLSWQYVLAWYIIAFQTFIDPSFHQRCAAAKNPQTAKNGILISIVFWLIFDFLTLTTGLYSAAYLHLPSPLDAYPILADTVMPNMWKGLLLVAIIATVMSTLESYSFISAATFGNDIFPQFLKKLSPELGTKIGLIVTGVLGILLAIVIPSAIDLIYKTSSIAVPALIIPLTVSYTQKYYLERKHSLIIMISTILLTLFWTLSNEYSEKFGLEILNFTHNFEPMMPGIILSVLLGIIFVKKRSK
ncbi:MAG: sodium:solute symporter family protein [Ignavibacteria bacterium]|nr:sodium:solute symporter family protein [Ignavibacteria bacterium]